MTSTALRSFTKQAGGLAFAATILLAVSVSGCSSSYDSATSAPPSESAVTTSVSADESTSPSSGAATPTSDASSAAETKTATATTSAATKQAPSNEASGVASSPKATDSSPAGVVADLPLTAQQVPDDPGYVRTETTAGPVYSVQGVAAYFGEGEQHPTVYALVPPEIVDRIPEGSQPIAYYKDHTWTGVVTGDDTVTDTRRWWRLGDGQGGNICGADCDVFPTDQQVTLVVHMLGSR